MSDNIAVVVKLTKMADDGRLQKMDVDYSSTVDEKIPECEKLSKVRCCYYIRYFVVLVLSKTFNF